MNTKQLTGNSQSHIVWLNENIGVHRKMKASWLQMQEHAQNDNIMLSIASGYRSFERQLSIWNRKFLGELPIKDHLGDTLQTEKLSNEERMWAILLFSALPGTSRHHWGSDIDVYAPNLLSENQTLQLEPWEYANDGPFSRLSTWLATYAQDYGFYLPYDKYRQGVAHEPWHLSYKPLSQNFAAELTVRKLTNTLKKTEFAGKSVVLLNLDKIVQQYVVNINEALL